MRQYRGYAFFLAGALLFLALSACGGGETPPPERAAPPAALKLALRPITDVLPFYLAQEKALYPKLHERVGTGSPASAPPLDEMWETWRAITAAADVYLDDRSYR